MQVRRGPSHFFALALCTGKGAWTEWKYQILLSDNSSVANISGTDYVLMSLRPSTSYTIQVSAYSPSGRGPISMPLTGKTLQETPYSISLLWASQNGLYSTDALGENVQPLIMGAELTQLGSVRSPYISSLAWHGRSSLYFTLTNGSVFHYSAENKSSGPKLSHVQAISFAQSIAFDYIGQKVYWSNPKRQAILRCGVSRCENGNIEVLQVVTTAKEIVIDSYRGFMLWSTGHSLEMSRLNGYFPTALFQTGLFSGEQIMGLTLDTNQSRVYFIIRSSTGSKVQRMSYNIVSPQVPRVIADYPDVAITGPIRYFNERLIWLQGSSQAVLVDVLGRSKSILSVDTISNMTSFHIRDQSSQRYPKISGNGKVQVVPNSVLPWSVNISGRAEVFTISWQNVTNMNFGKVFYEVYVNSTYSMRTQNCNITLKNSLFPPYSEIEIILTATSYWASSKPTTVRKKTPSAQPSEPRNPRIFVEKLSPIYYKTLLKGSAAASYKNHSTSFVLELEVVTAELRWDPPSAPNGKILGYIIHCWKDSMKKPDCMCAGDAKDLSCKLFNLNPKSGYKFAVQAYTDGGIGNESQQISVDFRQGNPVPKLMLATSDRLEIFDIDRNSVQPVYLGVLSPISSVYLASDESVYWINEGQDLMKSHVQSGNKTRVYSLNGVGEASHLAVDWIGKRLFWVVAFTGRDPRYAIMAFDLTSVENVIKPSPEIIMTSETEIKGITVNPFKSTLLWTTSKVNGITTIFSCKTDGTSPTSFLSRDPIHCNCSKCGSLGDPVTFDASGFESLGRGLLITNEQSIYLADETGCECLPLVNMSAHGFSHSHVPPYKLAGSSRNVFWSAGYLYASEKPGIGITQLKSTGVREITVLGPTSQPLPEISCLIPTKLEPQASLLSTPSSHSLNLNLPRAKLENCSLPDVSMAALKYQVFYGTVDDRGISECTPTSVASCKVILTSKNLLPITDLHPYTTYTVFVTVTNVYAEIMGMEPLAYSPILLRTAPGAPLPPKLLRVEKLNPTSLRVVWRQPDKLNGENVWYEINWQPEKKRISPGPGWSDVETQAGYNWSEPHSKSNEQRTEFHFDIREGLQSGCNYTVWVVAFSEKGDAFSVSENKTVMTYSNPANITLVRASPYALNLIWLPPKDKVIARHQVRYRMGWTADWNSTDVIETDQLVSPYNFTVSNLKPKTSYGFTIKTWFVGDVEHPYEWPRNGQFNFETLADKPGSPGQPLPRVVGQSLYDVYWNAADENGASLEIYSLECRTESGSPVYESAHITDHEVRRKKRDRPDTGTVEKLVSADQSLQSPTIFSHWVVVYNGTEPRWRVVGLDENGLYSFRVRAKNLYGWGSYSTEINNVKLSQLTIIAQPQQIGVIFLTVSLAIAILSVVGSIFIYVYRRKLKEKPSLQSPSSSEQRGLQLATIRELPGSSTFIHQSNILYAASDLVLDLELVGVPQIRSHQISLTKFLGSGAFGEVHEGIVFNLPTSGADDTRVAIKQLRKGASSAEKLEFIQEAKLMTQFRHPHILQLLGLCIDTDPCCLLLELMDGGDLLSYLRSNRPHLGSSIVLRMTDLLKMCVDVAKGCVYLEDMHFVHRDLAARNCLVRILQSGSGPADGRSEGIEHERVVKIGDFGLARDVYRNDYYRKEGEGLLPVRWMAPESLIDGVYTTQSDVWAFGVLMWEIMTLGQQPYPARNNLEVLHYVRAGGRLQQPLQCPDRLSELMLQCWQFSAEDRPTFKDCLTRLQLILQEFQGEIVHSNRNFPSFEPTELHLHQYNNYLQPGSEVKSSRYGCNGEADAVFADTFLTPSQPKGITPDGAIYNDHAQSNGFPKYLEVISDSNSETSNVHSLAFSQNTDEGYEIPLPKKPPRNPKNVGVISRLAPKHMRLPLDSVSDDIGLPSPVYWNTPAGQSGSMARIPYQNHGGGLDNQSITDDNSCSLQCQDVSSASSPGATCTNSRSKSYMNSRRVPKINGHGRQQSGDINSDSDGPSHFRNLLASTTSEDADYYSESEFNTPSGEGSGTFRTFKLQLKPVSGDLLERPADDDNLGSMSYPSSQGTTGQRSRSGRNAVSLSDSGNGSVDVDAQGCFPEDDNLRNSASGDWAHEPEYLPMYRHHQQQYAGNLNEAQNLVLRGLVQDQNNGNNSNACSSSKDSGTNRVNNSNSTGYFTNYIYDDAGDLRDQSNISRATGGDTQLRHQPFRLSPRICLNESPYYVDTMTPTPESSYYDSRSNTRMKISAANSG